MVKSVCFALSAKRVSKVPFRLNIFLCVKDLIWLLYRSLNVFQIMPM